MSSKKQHCYSVYGITILSDIPLDELRAANAEPDVEISLGSLDDELLADELDGAVSYERRGCTVRMSGNRTLCDWSGLGRFLVRDGESVLVEPADGVKETDLAPFITGAIMGSLLSQRGMMVLHGSVVSRGGNALAFLGEKGAGKSTLALHLQSSGLDLVSDDLIPLRFKGDSIITFPGFPRIRLWADSVRSIGLEPENLPKINSFFDKRSYECAGHISDEPLNIRRIYVLTEDEDTGVDLLESREAFIEIVKNTYLNRYLRAMGQTRKHFRQCEAIVNRLPVFRLRRPHDFEKMAEVAAIIAGNEE